MTCKEDLRDAFGEKTAARIKNDLGLAVKSVRTIDCYTIDATFTMPQLELVARDAYSDPITQNWSVDRPLARPSTGSSRWGSCPG